MHRLRTFLMVIAAGLLSLPVMGQVPIPNRMQFCGMELILSTGAQMELQKIVGQLRYNQVYFDEMVERAAIYMPFIEQALRQENAPQDLRFLAIQESALRPDVVSKSNAVGFWQFKEPTAVEVGLRVDDQIDERRHIYYSTLGAARYFSRNNRDFDNWVYAVIAYYEGPTGALPHTDPKNYGTSQMLVTEDLHWYVMKAIAHKIAYEDAISSWGTPRQPLVAHEINGESSFDELLNRHQISEIEFLNHNKWLLHTRRFPSLYDYTYFVPGVPGEALALRDEDSEPMGEVGNLNDLSYNYDFRNLPLVSQLSKPAVDPDTEAGFNSVSFKLKNDLEYRREYVLVEIGDDLGDFARFAGTTARDLRKWNGLSVDEQVHTGDLIYLRPLEDAEFHVVQEGETLIDLARRYDMRVRKLQRKNRMDREDYRIYIHQKLYLKKRKPRKEPVIILRFPEPGIGLVNPIQKWTLPPVSAPEEKVVASGPRPSEPVVDLNGRWLSHQVAQGETLWSIARRYRMRAAVLKRINNLGDQDIYPGQTLQIFTTR